MLFIASISVTHQKHEGQHTKLQAAYFSSELKFEFPFYFSFTNLTRPELYTCIW